MMLATTSMASASSTSLPLLSLPSRAEMERAYQGSDASYDGVFYLGVRTTGIFCRPSCPARKPKPENVEFFAQPKEALFAGYRPCLRCRPLDGDEAPAWVRPLLERIEQHPQARVRESDLRAMGLEPARVRRYFMTKFGLTFQAYCRARRLARAFEGIKDGTSLDDAVFETGYDSHSGFREAFEKAFGEPPGRAADARLHSTRRGSTRRSVRWSPAPRTTDSACSSSPIAVVSSSRLRRSASGSRPRSCHPIIRI